MYEVSVLFTGLAAALTTSYVLLVGIFQGIDLLEKI